MKPNGSVSDVADPGGTDAAGDGPNTRAMKPRSDTDPGSDCVVVLGRGGDESRRGFLSCERGCSSAGPLGSGRSYNT